MTYRYEAPVYEPRPHQEIIDAWFENIIKNNEPFRDEKRYGKRSALKLNYQIAVVALLLFWQLIQAVRNIAIDNASKIAYDMMGDRR